MKTFLQGQGPKTRWFASTGLAIVVLAACASGAGVKPGGSDVSITRPSATVPVDTVPFETSTTVTTMAPTTTAPATVAPTSIPPSPTTKPVTTKPVTTKPVGTTKPPATATLSSAQISAIWSSLTSAVRRFYDTGDLKIINDAFGALEKKYATANLQMGMGSQGSTIWYSIEANGGLRECRAEEDRYSEEAGVFIKSLVPGC